MNYGLVTKPSYTCIHDFPLVSSQWLSGHFHSCNSNLKVDHHVVGTTLQQREANLATLPPWVNTHIGHSIAVGEIGWQTHLTHISL